MIPEGPFVLAQHSGTGVTVQFFLDDCVIIETLTSHGPVIQSNRACPMMERENSKEDVVPRAQTFVVQDWLSANLS